MKANEAEINVVMPVTLLHFSLRALLAKAARFWTLAGFLLVVLPFWICFGSKHSAMIEEKERNPHV